MEIAGLEAWERVPDEPVPTSWQFPSPALWPNEDLIAVGADLEPGTILGAYRSGMFPMNVNRRRLGWWSPVERGILPLESFRPARSLRRSCRRYRLTVDLAYRRVMEACADRRRPNGWITPAFVDAYSRLHELGWTHSVEAWADDGRLAGALYGVRIGAMFAGESMVHHEPDGSKVALVGLIELLRANGAQLLDVQWVTPHLASLGAVAISRNEYLDRLAEALPPGRRPEG